MLRDTFTPFRTDCTARARAGASRARHFSGGTTAATSCANRVRMMSKDVSDLLRCFGMKAADVIAAAGAVIALLSLFATMWFAFLTRRHNRLSVRPYLDHHLLTSPTGPVTFKLLNAGIGPAIVRRCVYILDDNRYPIADQTFPQAIEDEIRRVRLNGVADYMAIAPHTCLPAGETFLVISFGSPEGTGGVR